MILSIACAATTMTTFSRLRSPKLPARPLSADPHLPVTAWLLCVLKTSQPVQSARSSSFSPPTPALLPVWNYPHHCLLLRYRSPQRFVYPQCAVATLSGRAFPLLIFEQKASLPRDSALLSRKVDFKRCPMIGGFLFFALFLFLFTATTSARGDHQGTAERGAVVRYIFRGSIQA